MTVTQQSAYLIKFEERDKYQTLKEKASELDVWPNRNGVKEANKNAARNNSGS